MIARIVLVILSLAATTAAAATPPAGTEFEQRCAADARQFCPDLKSGDPKLFKCLHRNDANVSRDCYYALKGKLVPGKNATMQKPSHGATFADCVVEAKQYCPGKSGKEEGACLATHKDALSAPCAADVEDQADRAQEPAGDAKKHAACKSDRETLCAGKQGDDAKACLKEHRADLSADCRTTLTGGGTS